MEEKEQEILFKQKLYEKYMNQKTYMLSKHVYYETLETVKKARSSSGTKSRNEYDLLSK